MTKNHGEIINGAVGESSANQLKLVKRKRGRPPKIRDREDPGPVQNGVKNSDDEQLNSHHINGNLLNYAKNNNVKNCIDDCDSEKENFNVKIEIKAELDLGMNCNANIQPDGEDCDNTLNGATIKAENISAEFDGDEVEFEEIKVENCEMEYYSMNDFDKQASELIDSSTSVQKKLISGRSESVCVKDEKKKVKSESSKALIPLKKKRLKRKKKLIFTVRKIRSRPSPTKKKLPNITDVTEPKNVPNITDVTQPKKVPNITDVTKRKKLPSITYMTKPRKLPNITDVTEPEENEPTTEKLSAEQSRSFYTVEVNAGSRHYCNLCTYVTLHRYSMRRHVSRTHAPPGAIGEDYIGFTTVRNVSNRYSCKLCKFRSNSVDSIKMHVSLPHKKDKPPVTPSRLPQVEQQEFLLKYTLEVKDGAKQYRCNLCNYISPTLFLVRRHLFTHNDEIKYKCDKPGCDYKSNSSYNVSRHKSSVHSSGGNSRYKCPYCQYSASELFRVKKHLRTHIILREAPTDCISNYIREVKDSTPAEATEHEKQLKDLEKLANSVQPFLFDFKNSQKVSNNQGYFNSEQQNTTDSRPDSSLLLSVISKQSEKINIEIISDKVETKCELSNCDGNFEQSSRVEQLSNQPAATSSNGNNELSYDENGDQSTPSIRSHDIEQSEENDSNKHNSSDFKKPPSILWTKTGPFSYKFICSICKYSHHSLAAATVHTCFAKLIKTLSCNQCSFRSSSPQEMSVHLSNHKGVSVPLHPYSDVYPISPEEMREHIEALCSQNLEDACPIPDVTEHSHVQLYMTKLYDLKSKLTDFCKSDISIQVENKFYS